MPDSSWHQTAVSSLYYNPLGYGNMESAKRASLGAQKRVIRWDIHDFLGGRLDRVHGAMSPGSFRVVRHREHGVALTTGAECQ